MSATILVVEDERDLAEGIRENLVDEGYQVVIAGTGTDALERILGETFDLVILDVMLPGLDGFEVCRRAREQGRDVPVLFLTARGGLDDRIRGLESGGDDYLPKPFHLRELLLRVEAIVRRRSWYGSVPEEGAELSFGGNHVDLRGGTAIAWDGAEQPLTEKELMILKALAERDGEVVTREEILEKVWGYEMYPSTRMIERLVERLRRYFERDPAAPSHLHTERGVGYRFTSEPED